MAYKTRPNMLLRPLVQRGLPLTTLARYRFTTQTHTRQFSTSFLAKMSAPHEGSTLKQKVPKQQQELPGLQKDMEPEPFDTSLETASGPKQYTGVGKLRGKKALITGGEYVRTIVLQRVYD